MKLRHPVRLLLSLGLCCWPHPSPARETGIGDSTLVRGTLWAGPERHAALEEALARDYLPLMAKYGLRLHPERGRAVPDSVLSLLFVAESAARYAEARKAMVDDPAFVSLRRSLSRDFGSDAGRIKAAQRMYQTPAGPGTRATAGAGTTIQLGSGRGYLHALDVTDGLAGPMVLSILQDRTGHLWLGTYNNGVSRYDGQTWTKYDTRDGLAHNQVREIYEDGDGDLWFVTAGGVSRFDGHTWKTYTRQEGAPTGHIYDMAAGPDGDLWFATVGHGLVQYTDGKWQTHGMDEGLPDDRIFSVMFDRDGALWAGTGIGVARRDAGGWTLYTEDDGLADNVVTHMLQDRRGVYWFATQKAGVSRFDGRTWVTDTQVGHITDLGSLFEDSRGGVWLPTAGAGAARYLDGGWTFLTTADGLAHNIVFCTGEDREGHIWIGNTGGVSRYDEHSLTVFSEADGLPARGVRYLLRHSSGDLWMAHGDWSLGMGVSRFDGVALQYFTAADGLPSSDIHSIYEDRDGHLWFTTSEGVTRYDGRTFFTLRAVDGLPAAETMAILHHRDGAFWFGTGSGLARYDGKSIVVYGEEDGLPGSHVMSLFEDSQGAMWVGTSDGFARHDGSVFEPFRTADGLGNGEVFDLAEAPDGSLWLATHGGISRFDGQTFTNYTTDNGLTSNDVHGVFFDRDGVLWIGTDGGGVGRFDGQVFQGLTRADGLPTNVTMSVTQDPAGDLWFSGTVGLIRHRPRHTPTYPVFIEAVVADRRYLGASPVEVPSNVDVVAFEFNGISFKTRPHQLVYRYRLTGYDDDWRQTRENRVEYDGLTRGEYVFEVESVDRDLNYSAGSASVPVRITFPYERLAWFLALDVAILLVVLQAVRVMRRDRRLQESNLALVDKTAALERAHGEVLQASQAKSAFLANVSHELRTPMNAIINFSSLILEDVYGDISEDLRDAVQEIDQNGGNLLALINDVLDLSKIEAGAMELQLGECAPESCIDMAVASVSHQAEARGLSLQREVEGELPILWADERRLTQQVLLNLVRNAVKFTTRGSVVVGAASDHGDVRFWVRDTGPGIPAAEREKVFDPFYQVDGSPTRQAEGTGLGLAIVRRFVEMHGGRIWLESEPGQGSTFQFTIPIRQPA